MERSGSVFLVSHVLEPGHDLPVAVGLLDGDVRHEPVGRRSVPVLFARLDIDHVAGADLLYLTAAAGDIADAVGDVERLPLGVVMPGGAGAGGESHVGTAHSRLL